MAIYIICFVIINILAYLLFGYDKYCAKSGRWRVPEATLLLAALAGGSIGAYIGMKRFHHKTKKLIFSIGVPAICAVQIAFLLIKILTID